MNDTSEEDTEDLMSKLSVYKLMSGGNYGCELCSAKNIPTIVEKKALMVRHLLRAHTQCHNYECSSCSVTFKKKSRLKSHCDTEHRQADDKKLFECAKCEHRSKDEDLLRLHALRKHASVYSYVCKCCAKCFKTWRAKNEHEKMEERSRNSGEPKPTYVCDMCNDILKTKQELIIHLKEIHSENFYKNGVKILRNCKHCNKLFMSRNSLREHLPNHEKSFASVPRWGCIAASLPEGHACEICGKRLSSKDHLKKHWRVHSGERPYVCQECGQAFALRTTMRIHALSHRGVKPYVCELCGLGYSQRSALMTHWKSKHRGLPAPPPIEIHHYFDKEGKVMASH
ncbi:PREDICTED: zinc finger protein 415-like isoform X2 [Ceratosolen solmsi marchali]|uniref:Zinc finger protein 415-like isoform X2 n=1 Tax=Ceratosolen solmsi marchali TaxID=326594 RepID=A0AAJ6YQ21_9HYME|nr:PREDICTED: zinc finger protein 415-like isoform X2 [Ceratosolen solmsi marchali]